MKLFFKEETYKLFKDKYFLGSWDRLMTNCPWATVFQSKTFVLTWYSYYKEHVPIVLVDWSGQKLNGLFTLALDEKGNITAAGTNQAEYQVWLSSTLESDKFLENSIGLLRNRFPGSILSLKYIPPKTPVKHLQYSSKWKQHLFIKPFPQPLMASNVEVLTRELKKKNRKEKINRLKRKGNLKFEIVTQYEEFITILDTLIVQSDFRKGAMYDKVVFQHESHRKNFLIELFGLGLLHVSVLRLNEEIIASNAGIIGFEMIHLQGINSHSPFHAKYSPGIIHFLMLGIESKNIGKKYFDLTPGGAKGYKEMLATTYQEAFELRVYSRLGNFFARKYEFLKGKIKKMLEKYPENKGKLNVLACFLQNFRKKSSLLFKNGLEVLNYEGINKVFSQQSKIYFQIHSGRTESLSDDFQIKKNNLQHLLIFDDSNEIVSRKDFLYDCMRRVELGHQFFCLLSGDSLCAVLWYISLQVKSGELNFANNNFDHPTLAFSYYQTKHLPETIDFLYSAIDQLKEPLPFNIQVAIKQKALIQFLNQSQKMKLI